MRHQAHATRGVQDSHHVMSPLSTNHDARPRCSANKPTRLVNNTIYSTEECHIVLPGMAAGPVRVAMPTIFGDRSLINCATPYNGTVPPVCALHVLVACCSRVGGLREPHATLRPHPPSPRLLRKCPLLPTPTRTPCAGDDGSSCSFVDMASPTPPPPI